MLRDTAVARVKQMLGFKLNLDAEIVQAMIEAQEDLERSSELPWFLRDPYSTTSTFAKLTPSVKSYATPTGFIREDEQSRFTLVDPYSLREWVITKDEEGHLRSRWPDRWPEMEGEGLPHGFSRRDGIFTFYPTPDKSYLVSGHYYKKDVSLSTNIENKWLKELPHIIIARSGLTLAAGLRDQAGLATFGAMNEIMTEKLHRMTVADDLAGTRYVIGGDED